MKITSLVRANSSIKDTEAEISYMSHVKMAYTQQQALFTKCSNGFGPLHF